MGWKLKACLNYSALGQVQSPPWQPCSSTTRALSALCLYRGKKKPNNWKWACSVNLHKVTWSHVHLWSQSELELFVSHLGQKNTLTRATQTLFSTSPWTFTERWEEEHRPSNSPFARFLLAEHKPAEPSTERTTPCPWNSHSQVISLTDAIRAHKEFSTPAFIANVIGLCVPQPSCE